MDPNTEPDVPAGASDDGLSGLDGRERVLVGYGEVMSIVQLWEQSLGVIWWITARRNPERATGDFDTPASQKEIARLEAAFLRMTAQAVRKIVAPHLDPTSADALGDLMGERNRLAHRFLRERSAAGGEFLPGTHDELMSLGERFMASLAATMRAIQAFEPYRGPVLPHWDTIADRIVERVSTGQAVPRDPREQ